MRYEIDTKWDKLQFYYTVIHCWALTAKRLAKDRMQYKSCVDKYVQGNFMGLFK